MGMSSSQARLLNLTTRMHQIEYKAAKIEAEKLQLANKSRRAFLEYQNALEQMKIQAKILNPNASVTAVDICLNTLSIDGKTRYLKDIDTDKLYIPKSLADKYHLDDSGVIGTEYQFMDNAGFETMITSFSTVPNGDATYSYTAAGTTNLGLTQRDVPMIDDSVDIGAKIDTETHKTPEGQTADISQLSDDITAFDSNTTYTINSAAGLLKLQTLVNKGVDTQGINFVLTDTIDMSNVSGWVGIGVENTSNTALRKSFKGIFDGNNYSITGLHGTDGLFACIEGNAMYENGEINGKNNEPMYGVVKDLLIETSNTGVNAGNNTSNNGILAGYTKNAYISNVNVSGKITGGQWTGGLVGQNEGGIITHSSSRVDVNGKNCVGGLIGHDTSGTILYSVASGNVKGTSSHVGGLIGHEYNGGNSYIAYCIANGSVSTTQSNKSTLGGFIGTIDTSAAHGSQATVENSYYNNNGSLEAIGQGDSHGQTPGSSGVTGTTKTINTTKIELPTKDSIKSSILYALDKAEIPTDTIEQNIDTWLNKFYVENNIYTDHTLVETALKLASINDYLNDYLVNGSDSGIADALKQDIENDTMTATRNYQNNYVVDTPYKYSAYVADTDVPATKTLNLNTGDIENINANLYTAFRKYGYTADMKYVADITNLKEWLTTKYGSDDRQLAEINKYTTDYLNGNNDGSELVNLYNAYHNTDKYNMPYTYATNCTSYNIEPTHQEQTYETGWDMENPDIVEALRFWEAAQHGYIIVSDEMSASKEWLDNMINIGNTVLIEYNKKETVYFDTSVATNTALQEVEDETNLRKAEAKYEADMRRIDMKDRKYDYDLAALEAERNAIKQEMETLKTVAKDNVDRTFRLFG